LLALIISYLLRSDSKQELLTPLNINANLNRKNYYDGGHGSLLSQFGQIMTIQFANVNSARFDEHPV
jgi:hypothetical protein